MKRILLYLHYNPQDSLSAYVLYTLREMIPLFERVVFISNSDIDDDLQQKIHEVCHSIVIRKNNGFDFGAWKDVLLEEGWDSLSCYDAVLLMNDTCFGPLYDLQKVFEKMEQKDIDFWGINNRESTPVGMPGSGGEIKEHIRSFFILFNKNVVCSDVFQGFWQDVVCFKDVNKVIQNYETELTELLVKNSFKHDVLFNVKESTYNHIYTYPDILVKNGCPFVKIKCFTQYFYYPRHLMNVIRKYSNYPVNLIVDHFREVYNYKLPYIIFNKALLSSALRLFK